MVAPVKQAFVTNVINQNTHARSDHGSYSRIATQTVVENESDNKQRRSEKTKVVAKANQTAATERHEERAPKGGLARRQTDILV